MNRDLEIPAGLSARGAEAARLIRRYLLTNELTYTGGCQAFYTPREWRERGEPYSQGAVLIVVHEGSEVAYLFDYDKVNGNYSAMEQMAEILGRAGFLAESMNGWSTAIYDEAASLRKTRAGRLRRRS